MSITHSGTPGSHRPTQCALGTDPRFVARRAGFRLALGSEPTTAELLVYPHTSDARELGWRVWLALATGLLLRDGADPSAAEALALELALPPEQTAGLALSEIFSRQQHAPMRVILQALSVAGRDGVQARL